MALGMVGTRSTCDRRYAGLGGGVGKRGGPSRRVYCTYLHRLFGSHVGSPGTRRIGSWDCRRPRGLGRAATHLLTLAGRALLEQIDSNTLIIPRWLCMH